MNCLHDFSSFCTFFHLKSSLYANYIVTYHDTTVCVMKMEENLVVREQKRLDAVLTAVQLQPFIQ
jgi:hypothetical protein